MSTMFLSVDTLCSINLCLCDIWVVVSGQCHSGVCFNGGTCMGGYSQMCSCSNGYTGPRCQYGEYIFNSLSYPLYHADLWCFKWVHFQFTRYCTHYFMQICDTSDTWVWHIIWFLSMKFVHFTTRSSYQDNRYLTWWDVPGNIGRLANHYAFCISTTHF